MAFETSDFKFDVNLPLGCTGQGCVYPDTNRTAYRLWLMPSIARNTITFLLVAKYALETPKSSAWVTNHRPSNQHKHVLRLTQLGACPHCEHRLCSPLSRGPFLCLGSLISVPSLHQAFATDLATADPGEQTDHLRRY